MVGWDRDCCLGTDHHLPPHYSNSPWKAPENTTHGKAMYDGLLLSELGKAIKLSDDEVDANLTSDKNRD